MAQKNTNPLDYPRYVRGLRPALAESLPTYVEDELEKLQNSMDGLAWEADYRITSISASFETDLAELTARVETEENVRATETSALATRTTAVETAINDPSTGLEAAHSRVTSEETARIAADDGLDGRIDAEASRITNVEVDLGAAEGRITTVETVQGTHDGQIATLELKRTVTLDNDGYVIGWEAVNSGVGSGSIIFRADTFAVGSPGVSTVFPLKISGGVVYINEARIENLSLGGEKLTDGAVTNVKISGTIQSDNYVAGVSGWKIDKTGATLAEFNGVVISRDLILGSGTVNIGPYGPTSGVAETKIIDTGIAVTSWDPNSGPLAVSFGFQNTSVTTLVGDEPNCYWEARPKSVFARNRYLGGATICIEVDIVGFWQSLSFPGSGGASPAELTWKVYDVT